MKSIMRRRVLALVLTLVMVLGLAVPVSRRMKAR